MKKRFFTLLVLGICLCVLFMVVDQGRAQKVNGVQAKGMAAASWELNSPGNIKVDVDFAKIPLYFISNQGQVNAQARFYAKARRYTLWVTKEGLVFDSVRKQGAGGKKQDSLFTNDQRPMTNDRLQMTKYDRDVSRLMFIGANKNPGMRAVKPAALKVNYFIGNDRSKWRCDVPTSLAVQYENLYQDIDLQVYGVEKQIEYDWVVKPGGNPAVIKFEYKGIKSTRIDSAGNLVIKTRFGELVHKKPVSYQVIDSKKKTVDVSFKKNGPDTYGFSVGRYDRSRDLVIDPLVLAYSTYLGGNSHDYGFGIAVDSSGCVYVTGGTGSADFPTLDAYQVDPGEDLYDAFVTKLDPSQSGAASLLYSTYLGGGDCEEGLGIAVDGSGHAYITGYTYSPDFPTLNPYQVDPGDGFTDVFVAKLDPSQSGVASFLYSTYLGGESSEYGRAIAVDSSGCAYITGYTYSSTFPTLNSYQTDQSSWDVFVAKFDLSQTGVESLIYSTYLGGRGGDYSYGIAVDSSGFVYVTGATDSTDFPTLAPFQSDQGTDDVFVAKLDLSQTGVESLLYSTYLGGGGSDYGQSVAVGNNGSVYVAGETYSNDFPTMNPYQADPGGVRYDDVFVARLDPSQSGTAGLLYSTYLGGEGHDSCYGIVLDSNEFAYITGYTESTDFPTLNPHQANLKGNTDAFISKLDLSQSGAASLLYSTYLGGDSSERGYGIAIDGRNHLYITGETLSMNFPILNSYQNNQALCDAFVTKFFQDPFIKVTTPNGGENWRLGSSQNITWLDVGVSGLLKITLWKDGVQQGVIADNINLEAGLYSWTAGNYASGTAAPGAGYTVKIKKTGAVLSDTSDAPFSLSASLILTSPNGGENWKLSSNRNINWQSGGVSGLLKITLWKNGSQQGVIADNVAPAAGFYTWTAGQHSGGMAAAGVGYSIKIKEAGTLIADTSDATFTLSPGITITSPNGGEAWAIGSSRNITWKSGGLANLIKITLWKDGVLKGTIATNVNPVSGSYAWTVGNYIGGTAAAGAGYRIKIKEINTSISDDSDAAFQLTQ